MGLVLVTMYVIDVYQAEFPVTFSRLPLRAASGVLVAGLVSTAFIYLRGPGEFVSIFGRGVLPVTLVLFAGWAAFSRYQVSKWAQSWNESARWLCIGNEEKISYFIKDMGNQGIIDVLLDKECAGKIIDSGKANVYCELEKFSEIDKSSLTGVILALDSPLPDKFTAELMHMRLEGIQVFDLSEFYERFMSKVPIFHLKDGWFVFSQGFNLLHHSAEMRVKRIVDIFAAVVGLVVFLPLILLASLLVTASSRGGPIFIQERTGLNGRTFKLYKIRTMVHNAESEGVRWASPDDKRVTPVGRFLRKTRIDELPQLWNVIKGDMSFIGPRPERPVFNRKLEKEIPYYDLRHLVKPGITGWAQVMYPYGASVEDARRKLEYDLYYIKNYSLILDVAIVLKTFRIVFGGRVF